MSEYPTDEEVERIKAWPIGDNKGLIEYVKSIWHWGDSCWKVDGNVYTVATGGWSGNEELIGALRNNFCFWALCWQSSHRGGKFVFEVQP